MEQSYPELTLRDYLRVLFRQKAVIITCVVTVMLTVFVGLKFRTPVYESSVKMLISAQKQVESPYYRDMAEGQASGAVNTQSEIVASSPVIDRVVQAIGLYKRPLDYEITFASPLKKPFIEKNALSLLAQLQKHDEAQRNSILFRQAADDLRRQIKVQPIRDTNLFTISVKDYSPETAAVLANVISRSYVIFDLEQQLAELQIK